MRRLWVRPLDSALKMIALAKGKSIDDHRSRFEIKREARF
jgi:hypothetical protein